ncbi:MAG: hypothetical protein RIR25_1932 [Verrucomicrobiota bacterium]|jgi:hypothetical protein
MRFVSTLIAIAALLCMGASTAPAAVGQLKPEVKLADTGRWQVLIRVFFLNGTSDIGFLRWTGVRNEINWGGATVNLLQGTGNGYQPEPSWNLVGSRIEIIGAPTQSVK